MSIGGDAADVRRMARRIREWSDAVEDDASSVRRAKDVDWKSAAAASFIDKLETRCQQTLDVAESMRDAADKVDHLADILEERQATLMHLLEQAGKTIEDAEAMVRDGVEDILGGVESLANQAKETAEDLLNGGKKLIGL